MTKNPKWRSILPRRLRIRLNNWRETEFFRKTRFLIPVLSLLKTKSSLSPPWERELGSKSKIRQRRLVEAGYDVEEYIAIVSSEIFLLDIVLVKGDFRFSVSANAFLLSKPLDEGGRNTKSPLSG